MFSQILQAAHDSGGEILVQIKGNPCEQYRGRIQDLTDQFFTLFHSGMAGGVLWAFKQEDIAFCGLVVNPPADLPLGFVPEDLPSDKAP